MFFSGRISRAGDRVASIMYLQWKTTGTFVGPTGNSMPNVPATCSKDLVLLQFGHKNVFLSGAVQCRGFKGGSARKLAGHPDSASPGQRNRRIVFETLSSRSVRRLRP